jgi:pyruvate kinase
MKQNQNLRFKTKHTERPINPNPTILNMKQTNNNSSRTKIVATIGPASSQKETLLEMAASGMDVCRLNFSHGTHEDHLKTINIVHAINKENKIHIAILADLQGPKIRIGEVEHNGVELKDGNELRFTTRACVGNSKKVYITYPQFPKDVKPGEKIMVDDGKIMLSVISTNMKDEVVTRIEHGGVLCSKKGVNLPNTKVSISCLTEKDLKDLDFILKNRIQWIGLSFVRSAADIIKLRTIIASKLKYKRPRVIAKIEKPEALADIDNIIRETDGLMVARGDLGVETPIESVPHIQKMLVRKCIEAAKPVIIATQMMESMITNITPTRAEVNDVANSVIDGADALMLSGETSVGADPANVIRTMQKIINNVEESENIYFKNCLPNNPNHPRYVSDSIICSAINLARQADAQAIIAMTHSGYSAYKISSLRPKSRICIFTNNHSLLSTLSLVWGIRGFYYDKFISTDHTIEDLIGKLRKEKFITDNDHVVNISSTPIGEKGMTNMIKLSRV